MIPQSEFTAEQQKALNSVRTSRVILPVVIGVSVVGYLFFRQFDIGEWNRIEWTANTLFWLGMSLTLLVVRHLSYATRLYVLSEGDFTFKKCIELVFIWEFSSAVTPTSAGGSAVALFVLTQEKLSAGRTAMLVLYTVVLDTAFFVILLTILYLLLGPSMIRPGVDNIFELSGWGGVFIASYVAMAIYGSFFFYGLFISPERIRSILRGMASWKLLRRFRKTLLSTARDTVQASEHMRSKPLRWHLSAFAATAGAWSCRFLLLSCLVIGFTDVATDLFTQVKLFARLQSMYLILAFSPTPGGAGFAETLFKDFLIDFVGDNQTSALLIATIWRGFTYYAYLLAGAIVIPNWLRGVIRRRAQRKLGVDGQLTEPLSADTPSAV